MTIFGPALDDLEVADVEAFLDGADREPLLWEAKGTAVDKHHVRKAACAFANGHEPGFLILGARFEGDRWVLDGVAFPGDEPETWITQVLADELRPRPYFVPKAWPTTEGRHVAVVEVHPLPAPPCVTRGTVYERLPGKSEPLRDSVRLHDLIRRGERAHETAINGVRPARAAHGWEGAQVAHVTLLARTVAYSADISSRLFTESFSRYLFEVLDDDFAAVTVGPLRMTQVVVHRSADVRVGSEIARLYMAVNWSGLVQIQFDWKSRQRFAVEVASLVERHVKPMAVAAYEALERIGGFGPWYLGLSVVHRDDGGMKATMLSRGPLEEPFKRSDRDSVTREIQRNSGEQVFEPEDDSDPPT